jgi:hypothetical protein
MEGKIWMKQNNDEWVQTDDNWPAGRRNARIIIDDQQAFGNYSLSEAIKIITDAISKKQTKDHYKYTIIPGKEMTQESKEKLVEFTKRKKQERGEIEPVESYISKEAE